MSDHYAYHLSMAQDGLFDEAADALALSERSILFQRTQARAKLHDATPYQSQRPCPQCGDTDAYLVVKSTQNVIHCGVCWTVIYNAPKTETGQKRRTVKTVRPDIKPSQQAQIFDRDNGRCVLCGNSGQLQVGHLLSVADGVRFGVGEDVLNDDSNLAAMCEACNAGLNERSVSPRTYATIMFRLVQAEKIRRMATATVARQDSAGPQATVARNLP